MAVWLACFNDVCDASGQDGEAIALRLFCVEARRELGETNTKGRRIRKNAWRAHWIDLDIAAVEDTVDREGWPVDRRIEYRLTEDSNRRRQDQRIPVDHESGRP